jgi:hypothetical protein
VLSANGLELVSPHVICESYVWDDEECRNVMKSVSDLLSEEEVTSLTKTIWRYDETQEDKEEEQYKVMADILTNSFKEVLESQFKQIIAQKTLEFYNQNLSEQELNRMYNQIFKAASQEVKEELRKNRELVFLNVLAWATAL